MEGENFEYNDASPTDFFYVKLIIDSFFLPTVAHIIFIKISNTILVLRSIGTSSRNSSEEELQ